MDPQTQTPENQQPQGPEPAAADPTAPAVPRRKSKIGRLPKAVRDTLNIMLLDGLPYAEILKNLGDSAKDITDNNLTRWGPTGYHDWLMEQHRLEETRVRQEVAMDLAHPDGGSRIHEATLQLAATSLSELVRKLDYSDFQALLREDPAKLIPFLNSLATISNAEIKCERHRLELEDRKAPLDQNQPAQKPPGLQPTTKQKLETDLHLM